MKSRVSQSGNNGCRQSCAQFNTIDVLHKLAGVNGEAISSQVPQHILGIIDKQQNQVVL